MKLLILGAGQYGTVAKEIAEAMGTFSEICFLDDHSDRAIGHLDEITEIEYDNATVAIGDPRVREQLLSRIHKKATLIHPRAIISPTATVGEGSIIEAGAVISSNAVVGVGTIVMSNAVVGHDAKVGNCCQLKYCSTIPERCIVPDHIKVECNAVYGDTNKA